MSKFIAIYNEDEIVTFADYDELSGAMFSLMNQRIKETAQERDKNFEDLEADDLDDLILEPGDEVPVYKTKDVIDAINKLNDVDEDEKKSLLRKLNKKTVEFELEFGSLLDDVLTELDPYPFETY